MLRISPTIQLSVGLVFLTVSILLLAQALGLTPGVRHEDRIFARQKLAEAIALQTSIAVKHDDRLFLESMFKQIVHDTPEVLSIALRRPDGSISYQSEGQHDKLWTLTHNQGSTATQIQVPINIDNYAKTTLEIAFEEIGKQQERLYGLPRTVWLILFICISGFIAYFIYLKRVLRHLDPSSVIPARVRNALNTMAEGVLILDKRSHVVLANDALLDKLRSSERKLVGRKADELGWRLEREETPVRYPWTIAQNSGERQKNVRMRMDYSDNNKMLFKVNSVPIIDDHGKNQGTINSFDDITELEEKNGMLNKMLKNLMEKQRDIEQKNKELHFMATRDPLTSCYNRRYLFDTLSKYFTTKNRTDFCVIMLDIDKFKRINDTYGHGVGDVVIKGVCDAVRKNIRNDDIIARFGGEEFCVILTDISPEHALVVAENCRKSVESASMEGVSITSSFGVAALTFGAKTPNELVLQADQALYHSKRNGRNRSTLWSPTVATQNEQTEGETLLARSG